MLFYSVSSHQMESTDVCVNTVVWPGTEKRDRSVDLPARIFVKH